MGNIPSRNHHHHNNNEQTSYNMGLRFKHYEVVQELCKGNSATLYLVKSSTNGKIYTLKKIRIPLSCQEVYFREAQNLETFKHPNVVNYIEAFPLSGKDDFNLCLVMEYIVGDSLHSHLKHIRSSLKTTLVMPWFIQLLETVAALHAHDIVHRDLKPENIILSTGDELQLRLVDFGLPTMPETPSSGPPLYYAAPEVLAHQSCDKGADVYSLGCILYEAASQKELTEIMAFLSDSEKMLSISLLKDKSVQKIVTQMLSKEPRLSADELLKTPEVIGWQNLFSNKKLSRNLSLGRNQKKQLFSVYIDALQHVESPAIVKNAILLLSEEEPHEYVASVLSIRSILTLLPTTDSQLEEKIFILLQRIARYDPFTFALEMRKENGLSHLCRYISVDPTIGGDLLTCSIKYYRANEELLHENDLTNIIDTLSENDLQASIDVTSALRFTNSFSLLKYTYNTIMPKVDRENFDMFAWCANKGRAFIRELGLLSEIIKLRPNTREGLFAWLNFLATITYDLSTDITKLSKLGVCTYWATMDKKTIQPVYWCKTCSPKTEAYTVCVPCARRCHENHNLIPNESNGYCVSAVMNEHKCHALQPAPPGLLDASFPIGVSYSSNVVRIPKGVRVRDKNRDIQITVGSLPIDFTETPKHAVQIVTLAFDSPMFDSNTVLKEDSKNTIAYFEVRVNAISTLDFIAIGMGPKNLNTIPGETKDSIGLHNEDGLIHSIESKFPCCKFTIHDIVGCGITNDKKAFFTLNGALIAIIPCLLMDSDQPIHPIVAVGGEGTSVTVIGNPMQKGFKFVFEKIIYEPGKYQHTLSPTLEDKAFAKLVCSETTLIPFLMELIRSIDLNYVGLRPLAFKVLLQLLADRNTLAQFDDQHRSILDFAEVPTKHKYQNILDTYEKEKLTLKQVPKALKTQHISSPNLTRLSASAPHPLKFPISSTQPPPSLSIPVKSPTNSTPAMKSPTFVPKSPTTIRRNEVERNEKSESNESSESENERGVSKHFLESFGPIKLRSINKPPLSSPKISPKHTLSSPISSSTSSSSFSISPVSSPATSRTSSSASSPVSVSSPESSHSKSPA